MMEWGRDEESGAEGPKSRVFGCVFGVLGVELVCVKFRGEGFTVGEKTCSNWFEKLKVIWLVTSNHFWWGVIPPFHEFSHFHW